MLDRAQERFGLWPARLAADSAYGSAENLAWLVHERGIEPHIPVFDKSQRSDGTFSRSDFAYDHARDLYTCPSGKELRPRQKAYRTERPLVDGEGVMRYRASKFDCDACLLKPQCSPNMPARKILRSIHEGSSRHGQGHRRDRRLCHLAARAEEGRNALRPSQAHPAARPTTTTRTQRRQRRVPPRRRSPEPQEARQAPAERTSDQDNVGGESARRQIAARDRLAQSRLFQQYPPIADIECLLPTGAF